MSWNPILDPSIPMGNAIDAIETVIVARARDLGGFEVRRALPSVKRQMVGPFIFFDQMGPAEFLTGQGVDVRPCPRIRKIPPPIFATLPPGRCRFWRVRARRCG
jgi:hypothetical protein